MLIYIYTHIYVHIYLSCLSLPRVGKRGKKTLNSCCLSEFLCSITVSTISPMFYVDKVVDFGNSFMRFLFPQESAKTKHPQLHYESKLYMLLQGGSMFSL